MLLRYSDITLFAAFYFGCELCVSVCCNCVANYHSIPIEVSERPVFPWMISLQIGLINLENEDFGKQLVEKTQTLFQVSN